MKHMKFIVVIAACLFAISAFAQSNTSPSTSDSKMAKPGDPIPGIDVRLVNANGESIKTVQSDATGQFLFTDVKAGQYQLMFANTADSKKIVSPRDAASGLPTGKRMHKPLNVQSDITSDNTQTVSGGHNSSRSNKSSASLNVAENDQGAANSARTVNTSRSNIKNQARTEVEEESAVQIVIANQPEGKKTYVVPHVFEQKGIAVIIGNDGKLQGNILKTKHDTVKNSINNVR